MSQVYDLISLSRSQVASILNCTPLTISNREKKGIYPAPSRNPVNNYRCYSLHDVFNLQMITFEGIHLTPIASVLWDMGYKDPTTCISLLEKAKGDFIDARQH